jgi:hypothetical protein
MKVSQHTEQDTAFAPQASPPVGDGNTDLADALKRAYCSLATGNTAELAPLYSEDVYFEDPSCNFKFHQTLDTGGEIFLAWTMILRQRGPKSGEVIRVEGASFLKVRNNRIYYHRDYFDLGAFVYENVPMLGSIIKRIKQRLAS